MGVLIALLAQSRSAAPKRSGQFGPGSAPSERQKHANDIPSVSGGSRSKSVRCTMQFRLLLKLAFVNELLVVVLEARPSGRSLIMARM